MNIPESWLRALCNPRLSGRELADKLTMAGVEVEAYEPVGPKFANVVVGEVLSVDRHPTADKLTVCKVKAGKETVQVVDEFVVTDAKRQVKALTRAGPTSVSVTDLAEVPEPAVTIAV